MPEKNNLHKGDSNGENISDPCITSSTFSSDRMTTRRSRTPVSYSGGTLIRSRSIPSVKYGAEDKPSGNKYPVTRSIGSGERTPVTHFCTPHRGSNKRLQPDDRANAKQSTLSSGKKGSDQQYKTPLRRFISETDLQKSSVTPDCFTKVHMDTPRNKLEEDLPILLGEEASNLTVGIRVRPLNQKEQNDPALENIVSVDGNEIIVACDSGTTHTFTYDHCFWSCDSQSAQFASQDIVFTTMVQPLIDKVFLGYNACLFAYGQTGSGKSYSMMGMDVDVGHAIGKEVGIIPRFCHELFERIASLEDSNVDTAKSTSSSANVEISYFEIYNEKIHDLLGGSSEGGKRAPLKVREHPVFGPYVVDLSVHGVTSYEDLQGWLTVGNSQRATAATGMNEKSSRSHSIFSIILTQTQEDVVEEECHKHSRRSKINLVDLAGSERLSQTCASGDRLREGVSINRSLLTLGKVIAALADSGNTKKKGFVPYRESILTWLLRESLGGNSRTAMLATISPANIHLDETLATLRYACQARTIVNRVRVNEHPHDRLIRHLRGEVERLREDYERQLKMGMPRRLLHDKTEFDKEEQIENLKEQLRHSEEQLKKAEKSWLERLEEAEKQKSAELNHLRRCGIALQLDWKQEQPCLVNLAADPSFSGTLLYLLPAGTVHIGQLGAAADQQPDIALNGPLVQPDHCIIENDDLKLTLIPGHEGETFVNGEVVKGRTSLHHGDRLIIGGNHYFRVSIPHESSMASPAQLLDYDYAHQEIRRIQEEKLHVELEEAKRQAFEELEEAKQEAERQLGFQKLNYEQQLEQLSTALEEIKKKKDTLEMEKNLVEAELLSHRNHRLAKEEITTDYNVTPYSSNFLKDIEDALNETMADTENILKMETSQLSDSTDSISLHELQIAVQEANQHCKELGINLEFHQQHVVGKSGLEPTVRIRDSVKHLVTFWKPSNFLEWLQHLRDYEANDSLKELLDLDVSWEDDSKENEDSDVHGTCRISVNVQQIKRQLNESVQQFSVASYDDSALENSRNSFSVSDNTVTSDYTTEVTNCVTDSKEVRKCLQEIETAANTLNRLCKNPKVQEDTNKFINQLKIVLGINHEDSFTHSNNSSQSSPELSEDSPHRRYFPYPSSDAFPVKSNLRSPCPNGITTPRTPKAVRFFQTAGEQNKNCM